MAKLGTGKGSLYGKACLLEMATRIGSIDSGKYADIAAWHRDLLTDEDAISECDFVMKEGKVYPTSNEVYDLEV